MMLQINFFASNISLFAIFPPDAFSLLCSFSEVLRSVPIVGREEMEEMEEDNIEIGRQRNEERRMEQAICAPGRCPSRPVEEAGRPGRSTGVHECCHAPQS